MRILGLDRLRNKLEASTFWLPVIHFFTNNKLYKKCSYFVARKKIRKLEEENIYNLAIENSSFCNARCVFCPNISMKRKKMIMGMDVFNKLIERLKEEKIGIRFVNLTGTGEPLLDKNIFEKIKILKREFPTAKLFLPTNFFLADKKMINNVIESGLDEIAISLNADNRSAYRRLMGLDFDKTVKNIEDLILINKKNNNKLMITITSVTNSINFKSVDNFVRRWKNKVDSVIINGEHSWAGAVESEDGKRNWKQRFLCKTLFEQIVVQSNGDIVMCCVDFEGKVVGGNVMKDKILKSFNEGKIGVIKKMHKSGDMGKIRMCKNCRFSERGMDWFV